MQILQQGSSRQTVYPPRLQPAAASCKVPRMNPCGALHRKRSRLQEPSCFCGGACNQKTQARHPPAQCVPKIFGAEGGRDAQRIWARGRWHAHLGQPLQQLRLKSKQGSLSGVRRSFAEAQREPPTSEAHLDHAWSRLRQRQLLAAPVVLPEAEEEVAT